MIDRFPDYERIGGAPFNFAFHLHQLGWPVRFLTRIGDDALGHQIMKRLRESGFQSEDIQIDTHRPTGVVEVTLNRRGVPQFEIRTNVAYDYLDLSRVPDLQLSAVQLIYFGTLVQRTARGCRQVQDLLKRIGPNTCCFCDINLRPPHVNPDAIQASLHRAHILKLNNEELMHISASNNGPENEAEAIEWLMHTSGISQLVLTSGSKGSKAITAGQTITSQPVRIETVVDTVGAGDAYAAVYAAGSLKGLPTHITLELASNFAAHICSLPGAVPSDLAVYKPLRKKIGP